MGGGGERGGGGVYGYGSGQILIYILCIDKIDTHLRAGFTARILWGQSDLKLYKSYLCIDSRNERHQ
jgi:hypothetical protein